MLWLYSPMRSGTPQRWRKGHELALCIQKLVLIDCQRHCLWEGTSQINAPDSFHPSSLSLLRNTRLCAKSGLCILLEEIAMPERHGGRRNGQPLPPPSEISAARQPRRSGRNWWTIITRARKEVPWYLRSSMDFQLHYYLYLFNVAILPVPCTAHKLMQRKTSLGGTTE